MERRVGGGGAVERRVGGGWGVGVDASSEDPR